MDTIEMKKKISHCRKNSKFY